MPEGPQKDIIKTASGNRTDNPKDISSKSDIVSFLDNQNIRTNPFGQNISGEHFYRRSERISAAIHLLTAHVFPEEPVRNAIRTESMQLLDFALLLRGVLRVSSSELLKKTQGSIRKIISLAEILSVAGYVSVNNSQSLIEAADELGNLLVTSQRSSLSEEITLTREDLVPRIRVEEPKHRGRPPVTSIHSETAVQPTPAVKERVESDILKAPKVADVGVRAERIMDIMRSGSFFGIKDIVSNLPEYSEKMIQRELSALVSLNKVKKMGAKRWSRYAVNR